jgi:8-oxo-dGTP pyrophosphatase MutT (NUDIX family)
MGKISAAGFIVINPSLNEVLVLMKDGAGDLPKGKIDKGEDPLEAAIRECFEEAHVKINSSSILDGRYFDYKKMRFFVAIQNGNPFVFPNPESGILEHDIAFWAPWKDAFEIMPNWLKPAIKYGRMISILLGQKNDINF